MKKLALLILFVLAAGSTIAPQASAKIFRNFYLQFYLPDDWTCVLANTEWICNPLNKVERRQAVLVVSAKAAGPEDNFEAFQRTLQSPRTVQSRSGAAVESKVLHVGETKIQGQKWLQGLHLGSEIEEFYTRYLVTVKEQLSILITLSCEKSVFTKYSTLFSKIVPTIRIIASPSILKKPLPTLGQKVLPDAGPPLAPEKLPDEPQGPERKPVLFWFLMALSVLVIILFIMALRGEQKKPRKRS